MKKKILVVDDNRMMRSFLTKLLEREGHEVLAADDGYTALNILVEDVPDILFIDLFMPKISGDKLCDIVRKMPHLNTCYLVIVSAAVAELGFDYTKVGANACIAKGPFDEMAKHVLAAVKASEAPPAAAGIEPIMGLGSENDVPAFARQMTKELLSRNRHLENILESIDQGIMEIYDGKIVYANAAAVSLTGSSLERLLARYFVTLFETIDQERVRSLLRLGGGTPAEIHPEDPVTLRGRQVAVSSFPLREKTATFIIMMTDVTDQVCLNFQRRYARSLKTLGSLIEGVARDMQRGFDGLRQNMTEIAREMGDGHPFLPKIKEIGRMIEGLGSRMSAAGDFETFEFEAPPLQIQPGRESILLADGDVIGRQIKRLLMEEIGYKVLIAHNGKEAVDKYRIRHGNRYNKIDLVIVDTALPDMDAEEVCRKLKEINPEIKVVVSGALGSENACKNGSIYGSCGFIDNPLDIRRLSSKIREALDTLV